ncbi:MAG: TolC family protein [Bacteroidales bacterium]|nr:TolC family protein [Bacteroidales bacterium]
MKKLVLLTLLMLVLPLLSFGQPWNIDRCVEYAIVHNPEILHRQLQYDNQKEILDEANVNRVPVISVGVQETLHSGNALIMYSVDENLTMSLTQVAANLEMPLLTGGYIPNTKTAEQYSLKAAAENITVSKINTRIRVAAAYLQLLNNKSQEQIAREQVDLCQEQLENVTRLVTEGKRTNADLAEARSALSSAEHLYTAAKGNTIISRVDLVNLIGLDDDTGFEIEELSDKVEETETVPLLPLLENIENHPSVLSAKYNMTSAEYRARAAKGALYPQLSMFANYNNYFYLPIGFKDIHVGSQLGTNGWGSLGLKLAVPILDLTTRKQASRSWLAFNDARVTLDESRKEISKQFREAYYQTLTARDRYTSAVKAEAAALESYDYQKKMYDVGRSTTYDLDQSRLKWFAASEEAVRSKYEYLLRNKILEYYTNYSHE